MADLLAVEGDRQVGVDRGAGHLAGRRVHPGRADRRESTGAPRSFICSISRAAPGRGSPSKPVPKSASIRHVGIAEVLLLVLRLRVDDAHVAPRLFEHARGDPAVASVRAAAADDRERARVAEVLERVLGRPPAPRAPSAPRPFRRTAPRPRASRPRCRAAQASWSATRQTARCKPLRVRHREVDRARAHLLRPGLRPPGEPHARLRPPDDLDLAPREAHAAAERLADGLLPGEARGVVLSRVPAAVAVLALGFREAARR